MGKIEEVLQQLSKVTPEAQEKALLSIVKKNEADLVDLNISQMLGGRNADGSEISPAYTPFTVRIKKAKGQTYDRVTLRDEGDFQQSMFAKTEKFPVILDSKDSKSQMLQAKYGDEIFGLDTQNKTLFVEEIKPEIQSYYKEALRL